MGLLLVIRAATYCSLPRKMSRRPDLLRQHAAGLAICRTTATWALHFPKLFWQPELYGGSQIQPVS
jgi:hypothetical protein